MPEVEPVVERAAAGAIQARPLRVLLIEDSASDAALIEREIRRGGFAPAITRVETPAEMRAELRGRTWDLIISDHNLPSSTSVDTLAAFNEAQIDVPFLIVSGVIGEEAAVEAMRAGATDYLLKDRIRRLGPVIDRELAQAAIRKAARAAEAQLAGNEAKSLREASERLKVLELLHELAAASSGVLDVAKLAELAVLSAVQLVGGDEAILRWWDAKAGLLRLVGTTDSRVWARRAQVTPDKSILGEPVLTRKPIVVNDYQRNPKAVAAGRIDGINALVAVPLLVEDRAVGALGVTSLGNRRFGAADTRILGLLGAQVAAAIEAARLRADLLESLALLEQSQEVGAIGTFVAWLTPEKAGRDEWSPTTMRIFGYTAETYDCTNEAFWRRVHPDDIDRVRTAQAEAHEAGSIYDIHHRIVRVDGEVRWIHERAAVERDASGKPVRFLGVCQDITEQELASQALQQSNDQFLGAFEGSAVGMGMISVTGDYMLVNAALCALLGHSREELVGRPARDYMYEPDFLPSVEAFRRMIARQAENHVVDARYKHRDGHLIWCRLHSSVVRDDNGGVRFFVCQVEDITQSMAAVAELTASEARHSAVIDAALDGMIVIDSAGVVTEFNPAAERMFGYPSEELIGREMAEMLIPERYREGHRNGVRRNVDANALGLSRRIELTARRADGTEFLIELSISRLETESAPFFSASVRDLTERDQLAESQLMLAKVIAAAPVILFACDADGTVTLAEGSALPSLGIDLARLGSNVFDRGGAIPELLEHVRRCLGGESFAGLIHVAKPDIWLEASYNPIRNDAGEVTAMVALATDVTDRVRGEAARQESAAKSQLVAIVNHEVRSPLNSILGFIQLLKLERVGPLNDKQRRYVTNVESAGLHLLALVNDSLDLSKIAAGKMDLEIVDMALAPVVAEAAEQVQPLIDSNGLAIELVAGGKLLRVRADRRKLLQIIWNLLSNAIRHTPAGGRITIEQRSAGETVEIIVTDSGVGMAADQLGPIFEDYTQVGARADGTGLGLPVSKRLAQLMDGDIGVRSEPGVGSTFTITLPAAKPRRGRSRGN